VGLFSPRLPLGAIVQWCRALRHGIDIGLSPVKIFKQQAKSGPSGARDLAKLIAERLAQGSSLENAMKPDRSKFPPLMIELIAVGEKTGRLTETFEELERYFEQSVSARKLFHGSLIWPGLMYFSGVCVIAIMLFILGALAPADGKGAFNPLGTFLSGSRGAAIVLFLGFGFAAFIICAYLFLRDNDPLRAKFEALALSIPGLSGCFRAFALQRFSMALHMTSEAGMNADEALNYSFRATTNGAYLKAAPAAVKQAQGGRAIDKILAGLDRKLFPEEFLDSVAVGVVTGSLAEVMAKQSEQYRDEAGRKLKWLTMLAGGSVYAMVGLMIIVVIIRMVMSIGAVYEDAMKGT
jgi:type IV pilus assembly protein PilC